MTIWAEFVLGAFAFVAFKRFKPNSSQPLNLRAELHHYATLLPLASNVVHFACVLPHTAKASIAGACLLVGLTL